MKEKMERMLELRKQINRLESEFDSLKDEVVKYAEETNQQVKYEGLGEVRYTKEKQTVSIDTAQLEKKEPELYESLLRDYEKVTVRKGYYSIVFDRDALKDA